VADSSRQGFLPPPWPSDLFWTSAFKAAREHVSDVNDVEQVLRAVRKSFLVVLQNHDGIGQG
jgi:hypothetical protein